MYILQPSLFSFDELMKYEPETRLQKIFFTLDLQPLLDRLPKADAGRNGYCTSDLIRALIAKQIEGIPCVKRLVERLKTDPVFRYVCGFKVIGSTPSESTFSRLIQRLSQNESLFEFFNSLVQRAITAGVVEGNTIALDSSEIDAYEKPLPKKKLINDGQHAHWGAKRDSDGNQIKWFGYKLHLACDVKSELPIALAVTPANTYDSEMAIPLIKDLTHNYGEVIHPKYYVMDAGYDAKEIYRYVWQEQNASAIIPLNNRGSKQPPEGMDYNGTPVCSAGYPMIYWGYDPKTKTNKFRCPHILGKKNCPFGSNWCSTSNYGMVVKTKVDEDPRRHCSPHRGTAKWQKLYNQRTAVERCFSRLKEYLSANNIKVRGIRKVTTHLLLNCIALIVGSMVTNHSAVAAA